MTTDVKMPRLSLTMEVGTIIQWLKSAGDHVSKGEELAELETDKVNVTLESPAEGYLRAQLVDAGVEVPCDTTIAILTATADEPLTAPSVSQPTVQSPPVPSGGEKRPDGVAPPPGGLAHLNASPAAKNLARELGVDLSRVVGTGPEARIGLDDVRRTAEASAAAAQTGDRTIPLSKVRAAIAQRMTLSHTTVPQFTVRRRVDLSAALRSRQARGGDGSAPFRPSIIDLIHLAAVRALLAHPEVNAGFQAGSSPEQSALVLHAGVHLGMVVSLEDGLVVPVIRNAHTMDLETLAGARARLQEEALHGRLEAGALGGATFTVSNLGPLHVDEFTAIVNPPEAAILAVGELQDTPVARNGAVAIVPMIALTMSADHRVLDGAAAARFLETLARQLDQPAAMP